MFHNSQGGCRFKHESVEQNLAKKFEEQAKMGGQDQKEADVGKGTEPEKKKETATKPTEKAKTETTKETEGDHRRKLILEAMQKKRAETERKERLLQEQKKKQEDKKKAEAAQREKEAQEQKEKEEQEQRNKKETEQRRADKLIAMQISKTTQLDKEVISEKRFETLQSVETNELVDDVQKEMKTTNGVKTVQITPTNGEMLLDREKYLHPDSTETPLIYVPVSATADTVIALVSQEVWPQTTTTTEGSQKEYTQEDYKNEEKLQEAAQLITKKYYLSCLKIEEIFSMEIRRVRRMTGDTNFSALGYVQQVLDMWNIENTTKTQAFGEE
jgi:hypothetical protein